jgi:alpha-amylase
LRKSLLDHFWDLDASLDQVAAGQARELSDFADGVYQSKIRRNPDRVQVQLIRQGNSDGRPLTITKGLTLSAGSDTLGAIQDRAYRRRALHSASSSTSLASLGNRRPVLPHSFPPLLGRARKGLVFTSAWPTPNASLVCTICALNLDEWLGLDVGLIWDRLTSVWTFPIETVSQSEGGFELVHQSVVVIPHWEIRGDAQGRWSTVMRLKLDTSLAASRVGESDSVFAPTVSIRR